nr:ribonuclease H-like domain-containing protein [Tanacetum cinerariifolium]
EDGNPARANIKQALGSGFNSLVHSLRALSALRRSVLRTASTDAKPYQGDSSEFYLITGRIPMVAAAGQKDVNSQLHTYSSNLSSMNSKKTYNTAFATLMYAVMIQDRVIPPPTQQIPYTILSIKLPNLKRGEYDIWARKMEHYLSHTDYPIWQVIQNDNGPVFVTTNTNGMIKVFPPKTTKEVVARERERKARTTLLMALPEDHLAKFHKMVDAKAMWEAIKSRFGGNDKSKKMQKYLLKQQFEGFSISSSEGLHKGYDRFQTLLSQLKIPGAGVLHEDANQNFDDLYNNLRVFEHDVKCTTTSSSNTQNVAFVSADNTRSTNDVSTAYSVSSPSVLKSQKKGSSSYTYEVIHSFFANQSSAPQLDYNDLEQINDDDMEKMDLKYQTKVECFNCHKMGHVARDCRAKENQDSRRRDDGYNGNKARDNGRRPAYQDDSKALVTIDGEDIDWSRHVEEDAQNYAMMA